MIEKTKMCVIFTEVLGHYVIFMSLQKVKNIGLATLNKEAIMSEIQRIGEGIIKSISYL